MPNLLPLVFTLFCFIMLKKDARRLLLIIFTVIFGLLGSLIGIYKRFGTIAKIAIVPNLF